MILSDFSEFDSYIDSLEARNEPTGAVVFYGSSTITMWGHERLRAQMKDITAVNRGFGGSTAEQALYYYDRMIKPLKPRALVWYEGDNDICCGYTPEESFALSERVFAWARKDMPGIKIYLLPVKSCPDREAFIPKYEEYRRLLRCYAANNENVFYINYIPMLYENSDVNGKLRRDIFLGDMLHFNDRGYTELSAVVYDNLKYSL
jgi:lysophospholipase L1-like esterase